MMLDVQAPIFFNPPTSSDFNKLRMSSSSWLDTDIASFLNVTEDTLEFPQSVPTHNPSPLAPLSPPPIAEIYYSTSSPETYSCGSDSPYTSDVSQTPSPFDASMFQEPPQTELYHYYMLHNCLNENKTYMGGTFFIYLISCSTGAIDIDPTLFEQSNLNNPLLLPEIEKILASTSYQTTTSAESSPVPHEGTGKKRQREAGMN